MAGWQFKAMAGAGALRSTVSDMLIFSRAMMAGSKGPLGPASQRMLEPLGKFQFAQIGYAVFIRGPEGKRSYMHDGLTAGYRAQWIISPSAQEAVIALASNSHASTSKMQNLLLAGLYPPTAQISAAPVGNIAEYSGTYRIDKSTAVAFVFQNAQLYRRIAGGVFRPLLPAGTDIFVDERFAIPPPPHQVYLTGLTRPIKRATDDNGADVTDIVRDRDTRYLDTFGRGVYQGVTRDHWVEIEIGDDVPNQHGWRD